MDVLRTYLLAMALAPLLTIAPAQAHPGNVAVSHQLNLDAVVSLPDTSFPESADDDPPVATDSNRITVNIGDMHTFIKEEFPSNKEHEHFGIVIETLPVHGTLKRCSSAARCSRINAGREFTTAEVSGNLDHINTLVYEPTGYVPAGSRDSFDFKIRDQKDILSNVATVSITLNARATGKPTINVGGAELYGAPRTDVRLTAGKGSIGDANGFHENRIIWQWKQSDSGMAGTFINIAGATSKYHTPSTASVGKYLQVCASLTDKIGSAEGPLCQSASHAVRVLRHVFAVSVAAGTSYTFKISDFSEGDYHWDRITIDSLPAGTRGRLKLSGVEVVAGQSISPSRASSLVYMPLAGASATNSRYADFDFTGTRRVRYAYHCTRYDDRNGEIYDTPPIDGVCPWGWHSHTRTVSRSSSYTMTIHLVSRAEGAPTVTAADGTDLSESGPNENITLTASKTGITDPNGINDSTLRWQWKEGSNLSDSFRDIATGSSYTPGRSQEGKYIKVCASFYNKYDPPAAQGPICWPSAYAVVGDEDEDAGDAFSGDDIAGCDIIGRFGNRYECLDTTTTNTPAVGTPTVSATDGTDLSVSGPRSGTVLVASARGLHDDDGIDQSTLAWQWQLADAADGTAPADDSYSDIAGATGHEFTPAYAMVGQYLRLCASFRDLGTPVADEGPLCWVSPFPVAGTDVAAQQTAQLAAAISGELLSDAEDVIGSQLDTQPTGQGFRAFAQLVQLYDGLRAAPAAAPSATGRPAYADASQMTATASRARDADHSMAHHRLAELPGTLSAAHRQHWYLGTDALAESHSAYHSRGDAASQLLQRLRSATDSLQMSWRGSGAARSLGLWARYHSTDLQGTSSTRQNAPMAIPAARMPTMGTASEGAISDAQAASGPLSWSGTGQRLYLGMEHSHSASLRTGLALGLDGAHLGADMEQDGHSDAMERTTTGIYPYLNWQLGAGNRLRIISGYGSGHIHMHSTLNRATATAPLQWRLLSANISHQTNQNGLLQGTLSGAISHSSATIGRAHFANRPTQLQGATHAAGRASLNARLTHNSSWQPFMEASARQAFGDHSQPLAYHIKGGMSRDHGPVQLRISHSRQINHSSLRQDHTNISLSISPAANIKASMDGKWDSRTGQPLATTRLDYHFHKADATLSLRTSSIGGGRWALEGRWRW